MANVKEHATPLAGAGVETGVKVHVTRDVADSAASGGCVSRLVRNSSSSATWEAVEAVGIDDLNEKVRSGKYVVAQSFVREGNPVWIMFPKGPNRYRDVPCNALEPGNSDQASFRDSSPSSASKIQDRPIHPKSDH